MWFASVVVIWYMRQLFFFIYCSEFIALVGAQPHKRDSYQLTDHCDDEASNDLTKIKRIVVNDSGLHSTAWNRTNHFKYLQGWIDSGNDNDDNERNQTLAIDIIHSSRNMFLELGQKCEDMTFNVENYRTRMILLVDTFNKCIELQLLEASIRILHLLIVLETLCLNNPIDDSSLLNYAIVPKLYQTTIQNMSATNMKLAMDVLDTLFFNGNAPEDKIVKKVFPRAIVEGPKWDAFVELSGYNSAFLHFYIQDYNGSNIIHEKILQMNESSLNVELRQEINVMKRKAYSTSIARIVDLEVFTVASHQNKELNNLIRSFNFARSDYISMELTILGLNEPFHGTFAKVQLLLKGIVTLPPNQLILFVDAFDTLIFPSIRDLPDMYYNGEMTNRVFKEIVFGAERSKTPYPDPGIGSLYEPISDDEPFYFLNSGIILGTAGALIDMAMTVVSYPSVLGSDQRGYTRYYLTNKDKVGLDTKGVAFLNLHALSETSYIDSKSGVLKNNIHKKMELQTHKYIRPSVIHGNGGRRGGKEYYRNIHSVANLVMKDAGKNESKFNGESNWLPIAAPPFTFAALVQEGRMTLDETLKVFREHVILNPSDVQSLLYLSIELSKLGRDWEYRTLLNQIHKQLKLP